MGARLERRRARRRAWAAALTAGALAVGAAAWAADWAEFRGPRRDGVSTERGLLKRWPPGGPKLLWATDGLGDGWGHPVIADGRIYVTGKVDDEGVLFALDLDGRVLWKRPYGPEWTKNYSAARHPPTVDAGGVYVMSGRARLSAFDADGGRLRWAVELHRRFGGKLLGFGFTESVLIDGERVICSPGAPDASVVALEKQTGRTAWTSKGLSDEYGYCAPVLVRHGDARLVVTVTARAVVGLDAAGGELLWRHPYRNRYGGHHVTPIYRDGRLLVVSGYGKGAVMLELAPDARKVAVAWTNPSLDTHHGGVVVVDGHVYGSTHKRKGWACVRWDDGRLCWAERGVGKGSVAAADGMLYCYGERGALALVRPDPRRFHAVSSFRITRGEGPHWAHPVIRGGRLYIRHGPVLMAYDVADGGGGTTRPAP